MPLDQQGFFQRVCEALGTDKVQQIADKTGIKKQSVYLWQNEGWPSLDNLFLISQSSNTSLHWLLTGEGEKWLSETVTGVTKSTASKVLSVDAAEGDWKLFSSLVDGKLHIRLQRGEVEISYIVASLTHDFTK